MSVTQGFSLTVVEFIYGMVDFDLGDSRQVPMFREVLADETNCALIKASPPGSLRVDEVDPRLEVTGPSLYAH